MVGCLVWWILGRCPANAHPNHRYLTNALCERSPFTHLLCAHTTMARFIYPHGTLTPCGLNRGAKSEMRSACARSTSGVVRRLDLARTHIQMPHFLLCPPALPIKLFDCS